MSQEIADGVPNEDGFFRGLAQAPLYFHNLVAELIDNAITSKPEKFTIRVDISEIPAETGWYNVTVVDDAMGISLEKLKSHAFKTGEPPDPNSLHLSEHGFGLKNVLAKIEALKGAWILRTRDDVALSQHTFYQASSPLKFRIPIDKKPAGDWPGYGSKNTGTIVQLRVRHQYIQTVIRGRRGQPPDNLGKLMVYLREHLGVFYRGYLEGGKKATGSIQTSINWGGMEEVDPVFPDYKTKDHIKKFTIQTAAGPLEVEGDYGLLETTSQITRNERVYYYRNTWESQGVDVRVGKRVVATRLLNEIWQLARHPSYNAFWGEIRIQPAILQRIPKTLNNKTSIDFEDKIWQDLAEEIRSIVPELPKGDYAKEEAELRHELYLQLNSHKLGADVIEENYPCFKGSGVVTDIYRNESARTGEVIIYETKAGKAHPLDVYQLRLYWDGLVEDGVQPTRAYLVAESKTTGTSTVILTVNSLQDKNNKKYVFEFKTWAYFNIVSKPK